MLQTLEIIRILTKQPNFIIKNNTEKNIYHKEKIKKIWKNIIAAKDIQKWENILFLETPKQINTAKKHKKIIWYRSKHKNIIFESETQIIATKNIKKWEILYLDYPSSNRPFILFPSKFIYWLVIYTIIGIFRLIIFLM